MHWLGDSFDEIRDFMQFIDGEEPNFHRFLQKFEILNSIEWTEELIDLSIKQVCDDMIAEGVHYCWMHFTINKYVEKIKWHRKDAIKFVCDSFNRHGGGRIGPILCLKYESTRASQRQIASLIEDPDIADIVHGVDLVGDEAFYDASFYRSALQPWKTANKIIFAHVGESCSAKNIGTAIEHVGVTDICHGIKLYEHPGLKQLAIERDVCFHMALTSNIMTGVIKDNGHHPIVAFLADGLNVTIGTDDPTQCNTTISREYMVLEKYLYNAYPDAYDLVSEYVVTVKDTAIGRVNKYGRVVNE